MNSVTENRTCPNCGASIPANAPQGVCPKCLMAAAAVSTEAGETRGKRPEPPSLERLAAAFPQLEVIELIGQGGMGAVYKARQKQLDRIVALKVLPPGIGEDPAFAERFTREAKALAKLMHPNIVALFEFGQADGVYYLLMEFVDGVSLGQLLRASRVSPREALAIVPQICDALQYAHDQGIVHRDIKPENILLDRRGRVKVADFGLAKLVCAEPLTPSLSPSDGERVAGPGEGKAAVLTGAGKIMRTPNYMAPEQVEHPGDVDHRADIYALGVVFYQMLTGELPGKSLEPPSKRVQIDVRLDEVVLRALQKKPELRYQQVSEVKTIVETIAGSGEDPAAEPGAGKGLPIGTALAKEEAEELGRNIARLFTRHGLLSFAKRSFLWLACQVLLLFDLFAPWAAFTERAGRRRFNLWLFLLMFSSTIGFGVYGEILAINLVQGLWQATSPALALQEWQMFQLMVLFAVGRLAGLNLGLREGTGAGMAQTAIAITPRRVVRVLLTLLGLAALVFGTALASNWLTTVPSTALTSIAGVAPWVAITIVVGLVFIVGFCFVRLQLRVFRAVKAATDESANADGLPAVEAWLALIDNRNYAQSWETAAAYFQRTISKEEWVRQMEHLRRPLGNVRSRKPRPPKSTAGWTSFGAQFAFATSFDGLPAATETVTFARQKPNGEWKAIGYLIKPAADGGKESDLRHPQVSGFSRQAETFAATPPRNGRREDAQPESGRPSESLTSLTGGSEGGTGPLPGKSRSLLCAWAAVASATVWCLTFLAAACLTFLVLPESFESSARIKTDHPPDRNFFKVECELIKSEVILGSVIEALKLKEVRGRRYNGGRKLTVKQTLELLRQCVELSSVRNTSLIEIHVFRERPDEAASIANAIADAYRQHRANQSAQLSQGLEKGMKDQLEAANGKIAAARQELDQLQKALNIGETAAQQSRDPALAEAKERPFWQKKRDLEDSLRFRNELASQVLSQSMGDVLPRTMSVEIVVRAVPALHPARANKPLNLALGAAGGGVLGLLAGGLVLLFGSGRVRPGELVQPSASN